MSTTCPIRNEKQLEKFKNYFLKAKPVYRNYAMIVLGLNTAFRISDLLILKWEDVYNEKNNCFREHIHISEQKTGKERSVAINSSVLEVLTVLQNEYGYHNSGQYLFASTKNKSRPISRSQAFRIIKEAAEYAGMEDNISCHSLRKTFGYQAWKQGALPTVLMDIYNHSSYRITRSYLGIEQEDRDKVYMDIHL